MEGGTSAVRSTNIFEPDRTARTLRIPRMASAEGVDDDDEMDEEEVMRGSTTWKREVRVDSETPASVRSLNACRRRPQPCLKIRIEIRVPVVSNQVRSASLRKHDAMSSPPMASNGNPGIAQLPNIAAKATALE